MAIKYLQVQKKLPIILMYNNRRYSVPRQISTPVTYYTLFSYLDKAAFHVPVDRGSIHGDRHGVLRDSLHRAALRVRGVHRPQYGMRSQGRRRGQYIFSCQYDKYCYVKICIL